MLYNEFLRIARDLEDHHSIFHKLWTISRPVFSDKIPTAGVYFDAVGSCIDFHINKEFWDKQTYEQKLFLICHECLHVILYHGHRISKLIKENRTAECMNANLALDIVVNHMLVEKLGFDRSVVDPTSKFVWVDTLFKDITPVPPTGKYFEYYYNLIKDEVAKQNQCGQGMGTLDDHGGLGSFTDEPGELEKFLQDNLTNEDVKDFKEVVENHNKELFSGTKPEDKDGKKVSGNTPGGQQAGSTPGSSWKRIIVPKVRPKRKWETVIKRWASKYASDEDNEQWLVKNRRLSALGDSELFLPSEREFDALDKRRVDVMFFLDTSGSCAHLAERFFKAAKSLPKDTFNVRAFCFDTKVYPVNLNDGKLYGFGGTQFDIIESYIQQDMAKNKIGYPKAVMLITDGYGNNVKPAKPKDWYWFLSEDYKQCIPKESQTFMLKDFE